MKNKKKSETPEAMPILFKLCAMWASFLVLALFVKARVLIMILEPIGVILFLSLIFACVSKMVKEKTK